MTKRQAISILIRHAARDVAGVGCGIRPGSTPEEITEVALAIQVMWPSAHGWPLSSSDWFNLGLNSAEELLDKRRSRDENAKARASKR